VRGCGIPLVIGALIGILAPALRAQETRATVAIRGIVRDSAGHPVSGVWVTAVQDSGQRCMIQSDSLGRFRLVLASPGHYWLTASARGRAGTSAFDVSLPADSARRFDFRLLPVPAINSGPGRQ
jgi:hypothetical protein